MSEFLLVVDGIMADGGDQAMIVGIEDYKAAMFGLAFDEPVHGYAWCDRHGWVLADESCVCGYCVMEYIEMQEQARVQQMIDDLPKAYGDGSCDPGCPVHGCSSYECACAWTAEALEILAADVAHMTEVEERAQLDTERAAEWAVQQFVSQYGEDWLDEGDHGEMAYRCINAREKAEFPHGEFGDGAHWREPAQALSPLSPGQWACEPCGDPDDSTDRLTDEEEEDLFFYWLYDESGQYVPVGRCRCGGLVVTQPGTTRVVCVECGADYPESPGWE